ncbi:hypothetical protein BDF14DRAFT_1877150 [Spinellus fusiger]|nr:hypothetical protein BDF14DRAFT_1877150 [Spinellus fusiger]
MARNKKSSLPEEEKWVAKFLGEDHSPPSKVLSRALSQGGAQGYYSWRDSQIPACVTIQPLLATLRRVKQVFDVYVESEYAPYKLSMEESEQIETVRKENVFSEKVTASEMDIIQQRVALQQRQFAEYERRETTRKSKKIKELYDYLTPEELDEMLVDCGHDEDEVIVRLTQSGYLLGIRRLIATKHAPEVESSHNLMSEEQQAAYQQLIKKRSETLKKTTNDTAKKQYRMGGRLGLDEALQQVQNHQVDPEKAFEGWSQARIRAYQMIDQNPNSYYYRFNAPGEVQRKGQWAEDEREVFFERLEELGANGQWGIFAMKVPGRVGYQCSNFYRLLVETGEVNDPNYVLDAKGKAHYLFDKKNADGQVEKTFRTHSKHGTGRISAPSSRSRATSVIDKKLKKRKRRTRGWDSDEEDDEHDFEDHNDDSGTFTLSTRASRRARSKLEQESIVNSKDIHHEDDAMESEDIDLENPLPGFIDPITLDEVVKPAISKYGHVMGWVRCLTNWEGKKNICPLTKNTLTKRDLVILTHENIDDYRSKIIM